MLYSAARFTVEFFRYHEQGNLWGGPLDTSQWISAALFALGAAYFTRRTSGRQGELLTRRHGDAEKFKRKNEK
jgi:prolipoprotein diacylglyceryltransferase